MQRPTRRPAGVPSSVAYLSMEVAVDDGLPSYSGGLGVLAGDHLRAAADLGLPLIGVTLLYRDGYFRQRLDVDGDQSEQPVHWTPADRLEQLDVRVELFLEGRPVQVGAWRLHLEGAGGHRVPLYFLDTDLEPNDAGARAITDQLYGGDLRHRLCQEAVLGLATPAVLEAVGHRDVRTFHMNEGHSALVALALLRREAGTGATPADALAAVRRRCVFTTHTPVPAGHDRFPADLVADVLGDEVREELAQAGYLEDGVLHMTLLALRSSRFANAVSRRHGEVTRAMFPNFPIASVTNGVHAASWISPPFQRLFDEKLPGWRLDNAVLHDAATLHLPDVQAAHRRAKGLLLSAVAERTGVVLDPGALTIGVARRATPYKRTDLLLRDVERLRSIAAKVGPLQVLYSGKAHPRDEPGKELIRRVVAAAGRLGTAVPVLYLEDYSLELGRLLCAGTDLWLNTPVKPAEASGTSGMKAALNGVPSLSVLDGWWVEGHLEGVTGWSIGGEGLGTGEEGEEEAEEEDLAELYDKLELDIAPLFFERPSQFAEVMRSAIALNGSFFTTERMVRQYARLAYRLEG